MSVWGGDAWDVNAPGVRRGCGECREKGSAGGGMSVFRAVNSTATTIR